MTQRLGGGSDKAASVNRGGNVEAAYWATQPRCTALDAELNSSDTLADALQPDALSALVVLEPHDWRPGKL